MPLRTASERLTHAISGHPNGNRGLAKVEPVSDAAMPVDDVMPVRVETSLDTLSIADKEGEVLATAMVCMLPVPLVEGNTLPSAWLTVTTRLEIILVPIIEGDTLPLAELPGKGGLGTMTLLPLTEGCGLPM